MPLTTIKTTGITDDAVGSAQIADDAVTSAAIADNIDIGGTLTNASAAVKVAGLETIYVPAAAM